MPSQTRRLVPPIVVELREFLKDPEIAPEDVATFQEWLNLKPSSWFKGKSLDEILEWAESNLISDLAQLKAQ